MTSKSEKCKRRDSATSGGQGNGEWKGNPKRFADYLEANGIELDFWKRKAIAENHLATALSGTERSGRLRNESALPRLRFKIFFLLRRVQI